MKTTSPSPRVESTAARSPDRSMAGPLVIRSGAPSSAAMIMAMVGLPSPGGPDSSTWSGGLPPRRPATGGAAVPARAGPLALVPVRALGGSPARGQPGGPPRRDRLVRLARLPAQVEQPGPDLVPPGLGARQRGPGGGQLALP